MSQPKKQKSKQPLPAPTIFAVEPDAPAFRSRRVASASTPQEADLFAMAAASPSNNGYEAWQQERQKARRAFEAQWRVPVGCRVRVQLSSLGRPLLEGVIRVIEEAAEDASPKERFLRIGDIAFSPREVESLVRL